MSLWPMLPRGPGGAGVRHVLLLVACCALLKPIGALAHDDHPVSTSDLSTRTIALRAGQALEIDLLAFCNARGQDCPADSLRVVSVPKEGVLFESESPSRLMYQHAGVSTVPETLVVASVGAHGVETPLFKVRLVPGNSDVRLDVLAPLPGARLSPGPVELRMTVSGGEADHVHVLLGEAAHVSVPIVSGAARHVVEGLSAGEHTIELSLAGADHRTLPGTTTRLTFVLDSQP